MPKLGIGSNSIAQIQSSRRRAISIPQLPVPPSPPVISYLSVSSTNTIRVTGNALYNGDYIKGTDPDVGTYFLREDSVYYFRFINTLTTGWYLEELASGAQPASVIQNDNSQIPTTGWTNPATNVAVNITLSALN